MKKWMINYFVILNIDNSLLNENRGGIAPIKRPKLKANLTHERITLFFFYKNIFYKNIEAEICEILRIF